MPLRTKKTSYIIYHTFYKLMSKTVAIKELTWEKLKRLMNEERAETFDELINKLIEKSEETPRSMFAIDRKRKLILTREEHERFSEEVH